MSDLSFRYDPWAGPAILLVDLDAFFASVEQLDHPAWRGKPVIVGGSADAHGVVSTASYEARAYGVKSAQPASLARQLCPEGIWTHGHYDRYREVSLQVMDILRRETPYVQQVSIDEAFVDVTPTAVNTEHPVLIAQRIQKEVSLLGVSCSIGVGSTKSIAKIASDIDKPRGLTVVYPGRESAFLSPLPVSVMSGVGKVAQAQLKAHGIKTLGEMATADEALLRRIFGKNANMMRARACGKDVSEVTPTRAVKSVSHEVTFAHDLTKTEDVHAAIATIAAKVGRRLRKKGLKGHVLTLKLRMEDRSIHTAQRQLGELLDDELVFAPVLYSMLSGLWREGMAIRLIGVGVSGFTLAESKQETLFDLDELSDANNEDTPLIADTDKRTRLLQAKDKLKDRFGEDAVVFGHELRNADNTTGTTAKNPDDYQ